ncbi:hypothetical protein KCU86_g7813, partial [Aureobasidium melanogenum]
MQLPEGGLPKGYEGCTTIKEIAKRKKTLESQPSRTSTTSTFTGQSWKPPKTSPTGSRQFSTLRTVWTKSKESKFDEQEPAQDSQPEEWTKLEAEMLEAKRQYDQMRYALKSAQNLESGSQEVTENDVHGARLRLRRAKHAWRMVSDPAYEAQQIAKDSSTVGVADVQDLTASGYGGDENPIRPWILTTNRISALNVFSEARTDDYQKLTRTALRFESSIQEARNSRVSDQKWIAPHSM